MFNHFTTAAAVAVAACLSAPVSAAAVDTGREPVRAVVRHADLNLARAEGRAALKLRVDHAIRRACTSSLSGAAAMADSARCRDEMLRDADVQLAALQPGAKVELAARQ